jgi:hypothetical protein
MGERCGRGRTLEYEHQTRCKYSAFDVSGRMAGGFMAELVGEMTASGGLGGGGGEKKILIYVVYYYLQAR